MRTFYYKAHDGDGKKQTGTIEAESHRVAITVLRMSGLKPYSVHDYQKAKSKLRRRFLIGGGVAILLAMVSGLGILLYAQRERAPDIEQLTRSGLIEALPGIVTTNTEEERQFGVEVYKLWNEVCPGGTSGIEINKSLLVVYVKAAIHTLSAEELKILASNTAKSRYKRLGGVGTTLLVVEQEETILEVNYSPMFGSRVKTYR